MDITDKDVVKSVNDGLEIGKENYIAFVKERFVTREKPFTEPVKKNMLPLFSTQKSKSQSKQVEKIVAQKTDCASFSRLYIAFQNRDGNFEEFFKHEIQPWPHFPAQMGKLRHGQKPDFSKMLRRLDRKKC